MTNSFGARQRLRAGKIDRDIFRLDAAGGGFDSLPFTLKVLLENLLRHEDGVNVTADDVTALANWDPKAKPDNEIAFTPARVILQDFTGVPAVVDLAAMRDAVVALGGKANAINPLSPAELVIDHSVQVDRFGTPTALAENNAIEFERNRERYQFLRWGQNAFENFRVVPPNTGIVHQVNLEYLSRVVFDAERNGRRLAYPDTLVGTDSHTTMINGLGVLGWGVGGIEAEAAMLGQPITMLIPEVVGFELKGRLAEGATATDLVLTVTEVLRKLGVVGKFVEFFGDGLDHLPLADRATLGNMSPEFGSTCAVFPIDDETLRYLKLTGRPAEQIDLVEAYSKEQGLWRDGGTARYSATIALDLADIEPCISGPKRPQERIALGAAAATVGKLLTDQHASAAIASDGNTFMMDDGAVVIAAITSCTNTSNPAVMVGAGLLARNALARGLKTKPWVKTSLAPGSKVVTDYLDRSGLLDDLEGLGFNIVGYGCTTCIVRGTPISLSNGMARRIEEMPLNGGIKVFGPTSNSGLATALQTEMMVQGERECVTLVLQDGRRLTCTPDHEILCTDGRWVRADRLAAGEDRVVMGLEAPLDERQADEAGYRLTAGKLEFSLSNESERSRLLTFARLLGHLLGSGSISEAGQGRMNVGQAVDREAVLDDIELLTGKRPAGTRYDERHWTVVLPRELTRAATALPGVRTGRQVLKAPTLPEFVLDPRCPVAVVREYLGGLFGADGHAPTLHRWGPNERQASLKAPGYSLSVKPRHAGHARRLVRDVIELLARCGVKTEGSKVCEYRTRRAAPSYPGASDGVPRIEIRLDLADGLSFVERVGFRYCVDKMLRASAAAVYWRIVDKVDRQRSWMALRLEELRHASESRSFDAARAVTATELAAHETPSFPHYSPLEGDDRSPPLPTSGPRKFRPSHRDSCGFPSPAELLEEIGARDWFAAQDRETPGAAAKKRNCVEQDSLELPAFGLTVVDRRPAGKQEVFDLAVDDLHAFIAGTVAVHNCIGNSGPLPPAIDKGIRESGLTACSVLSGNRNFEGRIHALVKMNFLASPPLVVAYALAGSMRVDLYKDALGTDSEGREVFLKDIWPSSKEIQDLIAVNVDADMFSKSYSAVFDGDDNWNGLEVPGGETFAWDDASTYIKNPPYFEGMTLETTPPGDIENARVLALLGDMVTTDHISPAGSIAPDSPAGRYLQELGVEPAGFNSYGSRRGNHEVMMRGTFANIRLRNQLAPGTEGGWTRHLPDGEQTSIYDAAMRYQDEGTPLIVLAGKEYGAGSSRDWAAKGTALLGVKAVIAESYERIHRSNLIGMGVVPLQYLEGESAATLGLTGEEVLSIRGLGNERVERVSVTARSADGREKTFEARVRIDTPKEQEYFVNGGILHYVLRQLAAA